MCRKLLVTLFIFTMVCCAKNKPAVKLDNKPMVLSIRNGVCIINGNNTLIIAISDNKLHIDYVTPNGVVSLAEPLLRFCFGELGVIFAGKGYVKCA